MIDFIMKDSDNIGILTIKGDLTIQFVSEIKASLAKSLNRVKSHLMINLESIGSIDLSGLQLLYSAKITADKSGKQMTLIGALPDVFIRNVKDTGYARYLDSMIEGAK